MGINFSMALQADYLAGHIRKQQSGELPLMMYHGPAYEMIIRYKQKADKILKQYEPQMVDDKLRGISSAGEFFKLTL